MDAPNSTFMAIFAVCFVVAWITALISWFRAVTARDRKSYWRSIALFVGPILLVLGIAELGGLFPETEYQYSSGIEPPDVNEVFGSMPLLQKLLLAGAGLVWLLGGSLLAISHRRRTKKRWWHAMNPLDPPFKDFNGKEWAILVGLVVVSMFLGVVAMYQDSTVL